MLYAILKAFRKFFGFADMILSFRKLLTFSYSFSFISEIGMFSQETINSFRELYLLTGLIRPLGI